jgi:hypothetical protein
LIVRANVCNISRMTWHILNNFTCLDNGSDKFDYRQFLCILSILCRLIGRACVLKLFSLFWNVYRCRNVPETRLLHRLRRSVLWLLRVRGVLRFHGGVQHSHSTLQAKLSSSSLAALVTMATALLITHMCNHGYSIPSQCIIGNHW